ncbi:MAG: non-canonical purine NTP pyrophosphatase, RdgB/HAM1 family [Bacteroidetes bacterium B1(2017)]|nr:MAG: non-canonical purine NTP pyrophosphatase, RdgB/HAM1 family [Bacteroidetes bacterium B1(2017)]
MNLIFASHNANKTKEISALLTGLVTVSSLSDIGYTQEIIESGSTLNENAFIKANTIFLHSSQNCFADDTGLLVDALNGQPGVYSARYAGPENNSQKNNAKLLNALEFVENRKAKFVTVICLFWKGQTHYFEGVLEGEITTEIKGEKGFGYDPIFRPLGSNRNLAEMELAEKNAISHRAKAFQKMLEFLKVELA